LAEPSPNRPDAPAAALTRRLALARAALFWERLWRLAWPLPALLTTFVGLALFDVLPRLPGWLHAAVLAGFVLALGWFGFRLRVLRWPSLAEGRRRAEQDSGFAHRPLQTLADDLAAGTGDPLAQALWAEERSRATKLARQTRLRLPSPGLAARDPYGLRFAPLLLLAIGLAGAWKDAPDRIERALLPQLGGFGGTPPLLQVWVTPPAYTKLAPLLLTPQASGARVGVPIGSKLLAELQGGHGTAQLELDHHAQDFQPLDTDSQRLEAVITKGERLEIRQGYRRVAAWDLAVISDLPPTIAFTADPAADDQGRLRLEVEAHDDYGVAKAWAIMRRADSPEAPPVLIDLPLGGGHPANVHQSAWHDLTGHPWAGLAVTLQPVARDDAEQEGMGAVVTTVLPERHFTNPLAIAVIELRRRLARDPEQREEVANRLDVLGADTSAYHGDVTVALALSDAEARLWHDDSPSAVPSVIDLLWQTALRLEEGDRPEAQRALDAAAEALDKALAEGAPPAEIQRLTDELEAAMARMLDAIAQQARRDGLTDLPTDPNAKTITPEELQDMMEQMRELSRTGSREAAQAMLSQFRSMMEGLRNGMHPPSSPEDAKAARQALSDLDAVTRDQQALLDQTFRHGQPAKSAAAAQDALRQRLGKVMSQMQALDAEIPEGLGKADLAMRDAAKSLRQGDEDGAVEAQTEAMAHLQDGGRQAMAAMARQLGSGTGSAAGAGRDPLGRLPGPGTLSHDDVKIPQKSDRQKSREVLDELRRRSADPARPPAEREYLQRLLKQFY